MDVGRLRELDLRDNSLQQVTQRSLAGLHAHLEIIKLDNNQLTTLDHCVFYRFDNMDFLKVGDVERMNVGGIQYTVLTESVAKGSIRTERLSTPSLSGDLAATRPK